MRNLYKGVFLGISLFAILGLALGPTLQTATAHSPGKIEEHCSDHSAASNGDCGRGGVPGCISPSGDKGLVHFIDVNGNKFHDHGTDASYGKKTASEPIICFAQHGPIKK